MAEWLWIPQKKMGLEKALWHYMNLSKKKEAGRCWEPKCTKVLVKWWKALGITIMTFLNFLLKLSDEPVWWSSLLGRSALLLRVDVISSIIPHVIIISQPILHHLRVQIFSIVIQEWGYRLLQTLFGNDANPWLRFCVDLGWCWENIRWWRGLGVWCWNVRGGFWGHASRSWCSWCRHQGRDRPGTSWLSLMSSRTWRGMCNKFARYSRNNLESKKKQEMRS